MTPWLLLTLFFAIIMLAHMLEAITGFGSTALSIPFLSVLLGVEIAKPLLMIYTMFLSIYILIRAYRDIDWKNLAVILGMAVLGLPVGLLLYNQLPREVLMIALGVFMVIISIRGLLFAFGAVREKGEPKNWLLLLALFCGGIIQGAFGSGGPLLILYTTQKIKDKSRFRATMCLVWLVLNSVLLIQMQVANQLSPEMWRFTLYGAPALLAGTILGNYAHKKVSDSVFTKLIYSVLLVSGVFIFFNL